MFFENAILARATTGDNKNFVATWKPFIKIISLKSNKIWRDLKWLRIKSFRRRKRCSTEIYLLIGDPPKVCKLHSQSFPVVITNAFNTFLFSDLILRFPGFYCDK